MLTRRQGGGYLQALQDQADLLVLFISEHQLLADDARLTGFINLAASAFGQELAERAHSGEIRADLDGYLFARSFMGSLVSFVLLQKVLGMDQIRPVDAEEFLSDLVTVYVKGAAAH
jgi:hypothetical protein